MTAVRDLEFIAKDEHLPLANVFANATPAALAAYHSASWQQAERREHERNDFRALCIYQDLPWDTKLLGLNALRVHYANAFDDGDGREAIVNKNRAKVLQCLMRELLAGWTSDGVQLVDARVSNQDLFVARSLEAAGFHLVDTLVTLGASKNQLAKIAPASPQSGVTIRPMTDGDVEALAEISAESFGDYAAIQDRFFLEPTIAHERSQNLFREWFINLATRKQQGFGEVIVAEGGGKPAGYIAIEPMASFEGQRWWRDALNAVSSEARGRGLYRTLVQAAFDFIRNTDSDGLITKTQVSTYRVINTWLHLGASIFESSTTFHWTV